MSARDVQRRVTTVAAVAMSAGILVQCTTPQPPDTATTTTTTTTTTASSVTTTPTTATGPAVEPVTAEQLGASWRPGCPVEPAQLRRVWLDYVGFDGQMHRGALVVNQDVVADVTAVFEALLRLRYPIERMHTPEQYPGAEDELSMRDNNTSAYNCRDIPGSGRWSFHAYGRAIDVNPLVNPYVARDGSFQPANAAPYLDRGQDGIGMLHDGDPAVLAFTDRGWRWGGHWRSPKDYQHFERD